MSQDHLMSITGASYNQQASCTPQGLAPDPHPKCVPSQRRLWHRTSPASVTENSPPWASGLFGAIVERNELAEMISTYACKNEPQMKTGYVTAIAS
eukprot:6138587-Amphidinium_carterae.1